MAVTGGSRGIGRHLCEHLVELGARVVALCRTSPKLAGVEWLSCDLGDRESIKAAMASTGASHGYLDALVVNAGIMPGIFAPIDTVPDELEEECFATNLVGAHFTVKYAVPLLLASPGKLERTVVYLSSSAGFLTEPEVGNGMLAYRASKAGLTGHMVALHQSFVADSETAAKVRGGESAAKLHRVVAVHPGFVQTGLGLETAEGFVDSATYAKAKAEWGAVTLDEGVDTTLWALAAADGIVRSGRLYYKRAEHSF